MFGHICTYSVIFLMHGRGLTRTSIHGLGSYSITLCCLKGDIPFKATVKPGFLTCFKQKFYLEN
jgi:hypothetical protein